MLEVRDLHAYYGDSHVLHGVDLTVGEGEVVAMVGRNGMGKTTTIHSILGVVASRQGTITMNGVALQRLKSHQIARTGLALVPEGRQIFPTLTVTENLIAMRANRTESRNPWVLERVFELFPALKERRRQLGTFLSGGEQQMLAIGRALMTNPRLLILDEATEGLAPLLRAAIWHCLAKLRELGQAVLIVDSNTKALAAIADRHYIIEKGRVVWNGRSADFEADPSLRDRYLSV